MGLETILLISWKWLTFWATLRMTLEFITLNGSYAFVYRIEFSVT